MHPRLSASAATSKVLLNSDERTGTPSRRSAQLEHWNGRGGLKHCSNTPVDCCVAPAAACRCLRGPPPQVPPPAATAAWPPLPCRLSCLQTTLVAKTGKGSNPKTHLYVGGLEATVNEAALHSAFIPFGDIKEVGAAQWGSQAGCSPALHARMRALRSVRLMPTGRGQHAGCSRGAAAPSHAAADCSPATSCCAGVDAAGPRHWGAPRLWLRRV